MNKKTIFLMFMTLMWTCIIFSFSLQPAEVSNGTSLGFIKKMEKIMPVFSEQIGAIPAEYLDILNHIVRKCAHFMEYFVLGVLYAVTLLQINGKYLYVKGFAFCVLTASVDETVQLFVSGRAGRISDVLIDSTGAAAGILLVFLTVYIKRRMGEKARKGSEAAR